jgi:hypothetical protein
MCPRIIRDSFVLQQKEREMYPRYKKEFCASATGKRIVAQLLLKGYTKANCDNCSFGPS